MANTTAIKDTTDTLIAAVVAEDTPFPESLGLVGEFAPPVEVGDDIEVEVRGSLLRQVVSSEMPTIRTSVEPPLCPLSSKRENRREVPVGALAIQE